MSDQSNYVDAIFNISIDFILTFSLKCQSDKLGPLQENRSTHALQIIVRYITMKIKCKRVSM